MEGNNNFATEELNVDEHSREWKDLSGMNNLHSSKRKMKKGVKVLITLIIILVLIIGGILVYFKFIKASAEDIYMGLIKDFDSDVTEQLNDEMKNTESALAQSGTISLFTNMKDYEVLNNTSLSYAMAGDAKDKSVLASVKYKENNKNVLGANIYLKDKKLYIDSKEIFSKTLVYNDIPTNSNISMGNSKDDIENAKYFVNKTNRYLENALKNAKYKTEYGKIDVNGKKALVQKNIMLIDSTSANKIKDEFLKNVKNDEKFIEILGIANSDKEDFEKALDEMTKSDISKDIKNIKIEIDTNLITNKFLKANMLYEQEKVFEITKNKEKEYKINSYSDNKSVFEGILKIKDDDNISFETKIEDYTLVIEYNEENDNSKVSAKIKNKNNEYFNIVSTNNTSNAKVKKVSTSNATDISKLTEQDTGEIENNISKLLESSKVLKALSQNISE